MISLFPNDTIMIWRDRITSAGAHYDANCNVARSALGGYSAESFVSTNNGCFERVGEDFAYVTRPFLGSPPTQNSVIISMCPTLDLNIFHGMEIIVSIDPDNFNYGILFHRW